MNSSAHVSYLEGSSYFLLSLASAVFVYALFHLYPVAYSMLIAEDHWAEYGTFVSFGLAGILLLSLSLRKARAWQRTIWLLFGLATLLIAGEEVSWGQRIFSLNVPTFIEERNLQAELTLHNMYALKEINERVHLAVACSIVFWIVVSLTLQFRNPSLWQKITDLGVPLIALHLVPPFLLQPLFFFFNLSAKSDELGELFLGIAALCWTLDLFIRNFGAQRISSVGSAGIIASTFVLGAFMSAILTHYFSEPPVWRLNMMAERGYPEFKMYDQAEQIYHYMYAHPQYLAPYTRINHGKLLLAQGKTAEAREVLKQAARDLDATDIPSEKLLQYHELLKTLNQE